MRKPAWNQVFLPNFQYESARVRLFVCAIISAGAGMPRTCRERAFLTVENFSQVTDFWSRKVACAVKIERIGKEVIRKQRQSSTKVAFNSRQNFPARHRKQSSFSDAP